MIPKRDVCFVRCLLWNALVGNSNISFSWISRIVENIFQRKIFILLKCVIQDTVADHSTTDCYICFLHLLLFIHYPKGTTVKKCRLKWWRKSHWFVSEQEASMIFQGTQLFSEWLWSTQRNLRWRTWTVRSPDSAGMDHIGCLLLLTRLLCFFIW